MSSKRLLGKTYKSTLMKRVLGRFENNVNDRPDFKQYLTPQHLQTTRSSDVKAAESLSAVPYDRVPSFRAIRDAEQGLPLSATADDNAQQLNSTPATKPVDYVHTLLQTPPNATAQGQTTALTEELALQMVTHPSHTQAQRGSSPHNLRLSFMGRRVLELHLQLFLHHASQEQAKLASLDPCGGQLIDTQRKLTIEEEDAADEVEVVEPAEVVEEVTPSTVGTVEEEKPSWEHPSVPSFGSAPVQPIEGAEFGQKNMWLIRREDGAILGNGTPGGLAQAVLDEELLGSVVGKLWNVDSAMRYQTQTDKSDRKLNEYRGSLVQSIFGGVSHAYGVGFTSRLFHARALPLLKDRLPEWTWPHVEEQRLKVLQEGGLWGKAKA